mgnify:CR=1 FL=1
MKTPEKSNNNPVKSIPQIQQITPKRIVAGGLVLILIFMWIRVFLGGGKEVNEASASIFKKTPKTEKVNRTRTFKHLDLPFVPGRHDKLANDIFTQKGITTESKNKKKKADTITREAEKAAVANLAKSLSLEAIILGKDKPGHQAFIDGNLLMAGDSLNVKFNKKNYKLQVKEIFHSKVILSWGQYTISVKMPKLDKP